MQPQLHTRLKGTPVAYSVGRNRPARPRNRQRDVRLAVDGWEPLHPHCARLGPHAVGHNRNRPPLPGGKGAEGGSGVLAAVVGAVPGGVGRGLVSGSVSGLVSG